MNIGKMTEVKINQKTIDEADNAARRLLTKASIRNKSEADEVILREVVANPKRAAKNPILQGALDFIRSLKK